MPVKWDAEKDKFILNCLLLDPSVNIGTAVIDGIAKSWPTEFGDKPTRKAITEHFFKVRKTNKKFGGHVSTPNGSPAKVSKTRATPVGKNGTKASTSNKRKHVNDYGNADDEDDDEEDKIAVSHGELAGLGRVRHEEVESPTKRVRSAVKYEESEDEGAQSGSDFDQDVF